MDRGTTVYKAYVGVSISPEHAFVIEGTVTEACIDGVPLVRYGTSLYPLTAGWHQERRGAERDIYREIIRHIGVLQAKADAMADDILHADLTTEDVA